MSRRERTNANESTERKPSMATATLPACWRRASVKVSAERLVRADPQVLHQLLHRRVAEGRGEARDADGARRGAAGVDSEERDGTWVTTSSSRSLTAAKRLRDRAACSHRTDSDGRALRLPSTRKPPGHDVRRLCSGLAGSTPMSATRRTPWRPPARTRSRSAGWRSPFLETGRCHSRIGASQPPSASRDSASTR